MPSDALPPAAFSNQRLNLQENAIKEKGLVAILHLGMLHVTKRIQAIIPTRMG